MSAAELLEELKQLTNGERLWVIEAATRLVREELTGERSDSHEERNRRLKASAEAARDLYLPGGELTEWTALDAEDFVDDYQQGRGLARES